MKIGLLGGSFNPIHNGHIAVAKSVLKQLALDKIWFLPTGKHPLKYNSTFLSFEKRYCLIKKTVSSYPDFEVYDFDRFENKPNYTDELIKKIKRLFPRNVFYFIIGEDNVGELPAWHNYKWLLENVRIVVVNRTASERTKWKKLDFIDKLVFINMPPVDISSTNIREKIIKNENIKGLVPETIEAELYGIFQKFSP
ncbi:MAG: nicotinate (nicotinamide) nucleotide adenylyltransferase [Candidatus Cloacimonetes bacterium]|nr:nicotinate (nicotinamide) nucleotide adenylyltransferase [Candidatus Cloacimonadota bacterium]